MAHNSPAGGELEAAMKKSRFTEEQIIGLWSRSCAASTV